MSLVCCYRDHNFALMSCDGRVSVLRNGEREKLADGWPKVARVNAQLLVGAVGGLGPAQDVLFSVEDVPDKGQLTFQDVHSLLPGICKRATAKYPSQELHGVLFGWDSACGDFR